MYEVEVKGELNVTIDSAMESLEREGFTFGQVQLQDDAIFALKSTDITRPRPGISVARVRTEEGTSTLTVKTRTEVSLSKIEHETTVGDPEEARALIQALGLKEIVHLQKSRRIGRLNDLTVCLDEVANLGVFVEFEMLYEEKPETAAEENLHIIAESLLPGQFTRINVGYDELALARGAATAAKNQIFAAGSPYSTNTYGNFTLFVTNRDGNNGQDIILTKGDIGGTSGVLCRITSRCVMSTALDADDCDCAKQTALALSMIQARGSGIFIYLDQEGRGHGLPTKVKAMSLKHKGYDTFSAFEAMGLKPDMTSYEYVSGILAALGVQSITLVSNNPDKANALIQTGVVIENIIPCAPKDVPKPALRHLEAKRRRGHTLEQLGESDAI
jgi:predicted adenylyl cyclase CyaB